MPVKRNKLVKLMDHHKSVNKLKLPPTSANNKQLNLTTVVNTEKAMSVTMISGMYFN